jgi:phosphoglycolate phosphatase-like HAD superfamily hydrolase
VKVRAFILDWSGTMVDDLPPVWRTTNHVFQACGLPAISLDQFRREFCLPVRKYYQPRIPHVSMAQLEAMFLAEYGKHQEEITLLPETRGFLELCRQSGWPVYIASTVDGRTYETQMARFGLAEFITKAYIGIEDKTRKIHQILAENRLTAGETLFVGDMEHDIEAGKAGGVRTCAVLSGYNHVEKLRAMQPDLVCADLGELQEVLIGSEISTITV